MAPTGNDNSLKAIWEGEELQKLRKRVLPIDPKACNCCTRHFYQNEFLSELSRLFSEHKYNGVTEAIAEKEGEDWRGVFWV
jgi:hypothetical protein